MHYDRRGRPISMLDWGNLRESRLRNGQDYYRIALDRLGEVTISTVWLGLDHGFRRGEPVIFETMVFGGRFDLDQMRYSTEEAAREGHRILTRVLRKLHEERRRSRTLYHQRHRRW